jgi:DNA-binding NtrC family response regulator
MHPVVDAFLGTSDDVDEILFRADDGSDPVVHAMLCLWRGRIGAFPLKEALKLAQAVFPPPKATDRLMYAMFLTSWSLAAARRNLREGLAIARLARVISDDETVPPEIRAFVLQTRFLMGYSAEVPRDLLARVPGNSPRRQSVLHFYLGSLATSGRLSEAQAELESIDRNAPRNRVILFTNAVEAGRIEEARSLSDGIIELARPFNNHPVASRFLILRVMQGERISGPTLLPDGRPQKQLVSFPVTMSALLERTPGEALHWAREEERAYPGIASSSPTSQAQSLVRAELAMGNAAAARRILEARIANTGIHYLDDLFRARIALLEGDRTAAARHFAAVRESCRRYGAEGRLEFELRMSCELSPADVMQMMSATPAAASPPDPTSPETTRCPAPEDRKGAARLVGDSPALAAVRSAIASCAPHDAPVLITGDTGTGKELVATAIHESSPRRDEPFTAVDCGTISEALLSSELFGHGKGAFTGADRAMPGLFVEAGAGTIFLDEIGELTPRMQAALLRVLEDGEIRPVGASRTRKIRCRVLAATNAPLDEMIERGTFRRDLYYRLHRLRVRIPPLRERIEDIVPLAIHFLSLGRNPGMRARLTPETQHALSRRTWPGNVRELRNEMERMRLLHSDKIEYGLQDLYDGVVMPASPGPAAVRPSAEPGAVSPGLPLRGKSPLRRRERLRDLFAQHQRLTTAEVCRLLDVASSTATGYLKTLCAEGSIEKVMPNRSPRTHYYRLKGTRES